jgi:predicted RNA-binding Zn-ribbon protein involved in translation (DUF1610 family)
MIRKAFLVVLTLLALLWLTSFRHVGPFGFPVQWNEPIPGLLIGVDSGALGVIYYHCPTCGKAGRDHTTTCPHRLGNTAGPRLVDLPPTLLTPASSWPKSFVWRESHTSQLVRYKILIPGWLTAFAIAAYPTFAFIRGPLRRWRRKRRGLCAACGYNLTANVSGVCPECGTTT